MAQHDFAGALQTGLPGLQSYPVGVREPQHKDIRNTDKGEN